VRKTLTVLCVVVFALMALGIVVLASASAVRGQGLYKDPLYFVNRQLVWFVISAVAVFAASRFDYHWWKETPKLVMLFYAAVVVALALVFVPVIGCKVNGSSRWVKLGHDALRIQPSELAKVLTVIAMGVWMDRIGWRVRQFWKGAVFPALGLGAIAGLLVLEPDFGATMVVCVVGGVLMFVAGTRLVYLLGFGALGAAGVGALLLTNANRIERITAWLHGEASDSSAAHQLKQSILAFENGGPWGVGFNQSIQKYSYLPEAHTDFIYAIGGEELGFVFSIGVILAYAAILVCGVFISMRAPDRLGRLLAFGMTLLLVFQAAFNIGVVTGCLPTKGLALPLISYGGTNLITAMLAVGTLVNVGRHVDVSDERMHTQVVKNAAIRL
jgi:cell division protein FtsW